MAQRSFQRSDRIGELVRTIVATEAERWDDDRLGFFTVTDVEMEADNRIAVVYYTAFDSDPATVKKALDEARPAVQRLVAHSVRMRHTPRVEFRLDRTRERVDAIQAAIARIHQQDQ